jgi:hypothetical protein
MRDLNLVLTCIQEEAAEVIQICSKIIRFGKDSCNPEDIEPISNEQKLMQELGDLFALLDIAEEETNLNFSDRDILLASRRKKEKLKFYLPVLPE